VLEEEVSDDAGTVDVEASGAEEDATLDVVEGVSVVVLFVIDGVICAGVEVEETNGGALSMYEPDGWTAYSPSSRSPLGVSYK
jgi:hypothetical protein